MTDVPPKTSRLKFIAKTCAGITATGTFISIVAPIFSTSGNDWQAFFWGLGQLWPELMLIMAACLIFIFWDKIAPSDAYKKFLRILNLAQRNRKALIAGVCIGLVLSAVVGKLVIHPNLGIQQFVKDRAYLYSGGVFQRFRAKMAYNALENAKAGNFARAIGNLESAKRWLAPAERANDVDTSIKFLKGIQKASDDSWDRYKALKNPNGLDRTSLGYLYMAVSFSPKTLEYSNELSMIAKSLSTAKSDIPAIVETCASNTNKPFPNELKYTAIALPITNFRLGESTTVRNLCSRIRAAYMLDGKRNQYAKRAAINALEHDFDRYWKLDKLEPVVSISLDHISDPNALYPDQ